VVDPGSEKDEKDENVGIEENRKTLNCDEIPIDTRQKEESQKQLDTLMEDKENLVAIDYSGD